MTNASIVNSSSLKIPRIGIACIVPNQGKVLLGKRKGAHGSGCWGFPGGHLEFGETVEACASRELLEETGLVCQSSCTGPWVEDIMIEDQKHYITIFVLINHFTGQLTLREPKKCECWEWFNWNNLPQPLFLPIISLIAKEKSNSGLETIIAKYLHG